MHPLRRARKSHHNRVLTQAELADLTGLSKSTIERAERGEPVSPYSCRQLCDFFGKTVVELGLISEERETVELVRLAEQEPAAVPSGILTHLQAIDIPLEQIKMDAEQQLGAQLLLGASDLVPLFNEGWSLETLLESLQVVLKGVQAMPKMTRRGIFQLGAGALVNGVLTGKHVSFEERELLRSALSESIAAGWRLFHTAGNAQVLAVGQAQLYLVQQNHSLLPSRDRAGFYTSVYNLIGKARHFQERYQEALDAHVNAHIAAMATGDPWYVTQSLICQADSHQVLGQHAQAIEVIEEALRVLGNPMEEALLRTKAHLLACWADNAMIIGEHRMAQKKLDEAAVFIERMSPSEEFDRATWFQMAGKYAFSTGDYTGAAEKYESALVELPSNWLIRQAFVLVPLIVTYACMRERDIGLDRAKRALAVISTLNAPVVTKQFIDAIQLGLLGAFPNDEKIMTFIADLKPRLPQWSAIVDSE